MAIVGRAKIEASRLEQLVNIESKRKEALASLNIKYATADKIKTSFGYIGIISLSLLWSSIILNDLAKIFHLCYEIVKDKLKEREQKKRIEQKEKEIEQVNLEMDEEYSQSLEEKLARVHLELIKACARQTCKKKLHE